MAFTDLNDVDATLIAAEADPTLSAASAEQIAATRALLAEARGKLIAASSLER